MELEKVGGNERHSLPSQYTRVLHRNPEIPVPEKMTDKKNAGKCPKRHCKRAVLPSDQY